MYACMDIDRSSRKKSIQYMHLAAIHGENVSEYIYIYIC
jgi:hypothetical protein